MRYLVSKLTTASIVLVCTACWPATLLAQSTIHVATCGDDGWTGANPVCMSPAGPKRTIQAAINAAADGDTVLVADGTYSDIGNRNLVFAGKQITLRSAGGPDGCIIDLLGSAAIPNRAFHFAAGETTSTVVEGFTIINGYMSRGGAVLCEGGSSPRFRDCIFRQNTADAVGPADGGGAVYVLASSPEFIDCRFEQNHVYAAGDGSGGGGLYANQGSPMLTRCLFIQNVVSGAEPRSGGGGILIIESSAPILTECTFSGNVASIVGGGMIAAGSDPTLYDCEFRENVSQSTEACGAGYFAVEGGESTLVDCRFIENQAVRCGGGMFVWLGTHATLTRCEFIGNTVQMLGGGGLGVQLASVTMHDCLVQGNTTAGGAGGMFVLGSSQAEITNTRFIGNIAQTNPGGGLQIFDNSSATLVNCLFDNNKALANSGGGLWASVSSQATLTNCTFSRNTGGSGAGGALRPINDSHITATNCILWGNLPVEISVGAGSSATVTHSIVRFGWPGAGNINADPMFVSMGTGDLSLQAGSPCIDAGNNAAVPDGEMTDLLGNPRFRDDPATPDTGVPDPARPTLAIVDIGAIEFQPAGNPCPADWNQDTAVNSQDISAFISSWLDSVQNATLGADFDGDGQVNSTDISAFITAWLAAVQAGGC